MSHREPTERERIVYGRACGQVREFFQTPKGKELQAQSEQTGKDLSLAMQAGPAAIKAMQDVQKSWPLDDCACESGIIFWHKKERFKIGRCDICRSPEKPANVRGVKIWDQRQGG